MAVTDAVSSAGLLIGAVLSGGELVSVVLDTAPVSGWNGAVNYSDIAIPTSLAGPITATATSLSVNFLNGWPPPPFRAVISRGSVLAETVLVTDVDGATLSVERGGDGVAWPHPGNASFIHVLTAADLGAANGHYLSGSLDVHPQYLSADRHDSVALHAAGVSLGVPTVEPSFSHWGDQAREGISLLAALSDHQHPTSAKIIVQGEAMPAGVVMLVPQVALTTLPWLAGPPPQSATVDFPVPVVGSISGSGLLSDGGEMRRSVQVPSFTPSSPPLGDYLPLTSVPTSVTVAASGSGAVTSWTANPPVPVSGWVALISPTGGGSFVTNGQTSGTAIISGSPALGLFLEDLGVVPEDGPSGTQVLQGGANPALTNGQSYVYCDWSRTAVTAFSYSQGYTSYSYSVWEQTFTPVTTAATYTTQPPTYQAVSESVSVYYSIERPTATSLGSQASGTTWVNEVTQVGREEFYVATGHHLVPTDMIAYKVTRTRTTWSPSGSASRSSQSPPSLLPVGWGVATSAEAAGYTDTTAEVTSSTATTLSMTPMISSSSESSSSVTTSTFTPTSAAEAGVSAATAAAYPYLYTQVDVTQPVAPASFGDVDGPLPGAAVVLPPTPPEGGIALDWSATAGYALNLAAWTIRSQP